MGSTFFFPFFFFGELEVLQSMQGLRRANQRNSQGENVREPSVTQGGTHWGNVRVILG